MNNEEETNEIEIVNSDNEAVTLLELLKNSLATLPTQQVLMITGDMIKEVSDRFASVTETEVIDKETVANVSQQVRLLLVDLDRIATMKQRTIIIETLLNQRILKRGSGKTVTSTIRNIYMEGDTRYGDAILGRGKTIAYFSEILNVWVTEK